MPRGDGTGPKGQGPGTGSGMGSRRGSRGRGDGFGAGPGGYCICPKCGDNRIAGPHRVHADRMHLKIDLPGLSTATLESFTCASCGYTELYSDPMGLSNIRSSGRFRTPAHHEAPKTCPVCATKVHPSSDRCSECGYQLN